MCHDSCLHPWPRGLQPRLLPSLETLLREKSSLKLKHFVRNLQKSFSKET